MLSDIYDEYSLKARVRPTLLALLPVILAVYAAYPTLYAAGAALIGLLIMCGLVTALAGYTRHRGRKVERKLFDQWGAKPTTLILQHRDPTIDAETKARYHAYLQHALGGKPFPSNEQETSNPADADIRYESAVRWLLEKTRDTHQYNLLFQENINYGFRRNCLGIKWLGVTSSLLSTIFLIINVLTGGFLGSAPNIVICGGAALLSFLLLVWWLLAVNSNSVRDGAEAYALRLVSSCDVPN